METIYMTIKCGHCGNKAPMEVVAEYNRIEDCEDERGTFPLTWEYGPVWRIVRCPACWEVTFLKYIYHSMFEPNEWRLEILYPVSEEKELLGLPPRVEKEYNEALRVRNISTNLYAVALGRVIDQVCNDRGAEGKTTFERIESLARIGDIPKRLANMAHQLRSLRNIGAHPNLGQLSLEEVPILDSICSAILEYIYAAPKLIEHVENRLKILKEKSMRETVG